MGPIGGSMGPGWAQSALDSRRPNTRMSASTGAVCLHDRAERVRHLVELVVRGPRSRWRWAHESAPGVGRHARIGGPGAHACESDTRSLRRLPRSPGHYPSVDPCCPSGTDRLAGRRTHRQESGLQSSPRGSAVRLVAPDGPFVPGESDSDPAQVGIAGQPAARSRDRAEPFGGGPPVRPTWTESSHALGVGARRGRARAAHPRCGQGVSTVFPQIQARTQAER